MEKKKIVTKKEVKKVKEVPKEKKLNLNPLVWEVPYKADLIAQVMYVYRSNERKGTAKQKSKGEVSGGGKKPWKQKGTGRARHGSIRSPLWVGGGVTFASHDRNYSRKINKKMAKKALSMMLSKRLKDEKLDFVKFSKTESSKLRKDSVQGTLVVTPVKETELFLRNTSNVSIVSPEKLNAKHVVSARKVLIEEESVKILEERILNEK